MKEPMTPFEARIPKESRTIHIVDKDGDDIIPPITTPHNELNEDDAWERRKEIASIIVEALNQQWGEQQ